MPMQEVHLATLEYLMLLVQLLHSIPERMSTAVQLA